MFCVEASEMQLSMSLVCVPLDVEDTLSCYREALDKSPHCLQVLQHSRSLVVQLLAGSQTCRFIGYYTTDAHTHMLSGGGKSADVALHALQHSFQIIKTEVSAFHQARLPSALQFCSLRICYRMTCMRRTLELQVPSTAIPLVSRAYQLLLLHT